MNECPVTKDTAPRLGPQRIPGAGDALVLVRDGDGLSLDHFQTQEHGWVIGLSVFDNRLGIGFFKTMSPDTCRTLAAALLTIASEQEEKNKELNA